MSSSARSKTRSGLDQRGFALLEVVIASLIIGITVLGVSLMLVRGSAFVSSESTSQGELYLAEQKLERLRVLGFTGASVLGPSDAGATAGCATDTEPCYNETLQGGVVANSKLQSFTRLTCVDYVTDSGPPYPAACPSTPSAQPVLPDRFHEHDVHETGPGDGPAAQSGNDRGGRADHARDDPHQSTSTADWFMNQRGISVLELVIALTIGSVVLLAAGAFYRSVVFTSKSDFSEADLQNQATIIAAEIQRQVEAATTIAACYQDPTASWTAATAAMVRPTTRSSCTWRKQTGASTASTRTAIS